MQDKPGIFHQLGHQLAKEFQREKLFLSHESTDDFYRSQWQIKKKSLVWLIYRWIVALIFTATVIGSLTNLFCGGKWFIFLTNWGLSMCTFTALCGAVLVTLYYFDKANTVSPWVLKMYWLFYSITLVVATVITLVYWTAIYPAQDEETMGAPVINIVSHAFNSILMILDIMLVAFPAHILHVIYTLGFCIIYMTFTIIFYLAGGVDCYGHVFIYPILDWSKPGLAVLTTLATMVLICAFSCFHFGLYKLRTFIYRKRRTTVITLNV